jgi:hypothetical protein
VRVSLVCKLIINTMGYGITSNCPGVSTNLSQDDSNTTHEVSFTLLLHEHHTHSWTYRSVGSPKYIDQPNSIHDIFGDIASWRGWICTYVSIVKGGIFIIVPLVMSGYLPTEWNVGIHPHQTNISEEIKDSFTRRSLLTNLLLNSAFKHYLVFPFDFILSYL